MPTRLSWSLTSFGTPTTIKLASCEVFIVPQEREDALCYQSIQEDGRQLAQIDKAFFHAGQLATSLEEHERILGCSPLHPQQNNFGRRIVLGNDLPPFSVLCSVRGSGCLCFAGASAIACGANNRRRSGLPLPPPQPAAHARRYRETRFKAGDQYDVVVASFDPADTTADSVEARQDFMMMIATPDGRMSKYLAGINYPSRDVRLALIEASDHRIGTLSDLVLLYCCNYVPSQGKYTVAILCVMALAGMASLVALVGLFFLLRRKPKGHAA